MDQNYDAKSIDAQQNYVRELAFATIDSCNLVTHSNMDGGIRVLKVCSRHYGHNDVGCGLFD